MAKVKFYKYLRIGVKGPLISMVACGRASVVYKEGKLIKAPKWLANRGYGLCVFDTALNAINAADYYGWQHGVLREVEVKEGDIIQMLQPICCSYGILDGYTNPLVNVSWPKGTVMVKSLRLLTL